MPDEQSGETSAELSDVEPLWRQVNETGASIACLPFLPLTCPIPSARLATKTSPLTPYSQPGQNTPPPTPVEMRCYVPVNDAKRNCLIVIFFVLREHLLLSLSARSLSSALCLISASYYGSTPSDLSFLFRQKKAN